MSPGICLKCKATIDADSVYCKYCGKKQVKTEKARELKKPNGYGSVIKLTGRRRKPWAVRLTKSIVDGKQTYWYVSITKQKKKLWRLLQKSKYIPLPQRAKSR